MTGNIEIDKPAIKEADRKQAIELAIKEIEAHKEAHLIEGYTDRLIASAKVIAEYIKLGPN
jgi:hypothetical protein